MKSSQEPFELWSVDCHNEKVYNHIIGRYEK